ncbi:MAG TPA: hypothetical protein VJ914_24820 [Pseudonocardiaceae bacterium]|nr:hypothetical protein [Pseudonocardiaceae bacterium]
MNLAKAPLVGIAAMVSALSLAACGSLATTGVRPVSDTVPQTTSFPTGFYGINWDYPSAAQFARTTNVDSLLGQLDPGTLRWPGGTSADYFDWRSGKPTGKNGQDNFTFTLADLDNAYKSTGATPMFDLNVLAHPTDTADQLAMLSTAESMGMPIKYVEIGNELYGGGPNGEFANTFADGKKYGQTVALYVRALHAKFPGVQVAADGCLHPFTAREQNWNNELLTTATGAGSPDAIILHSYPGLTDDPFTAADVPPLFANAYSGIDELSQAVRKLGGKPVWLTEFNFRGPYSPHKPTKPNPVDGSYARELYVAELAMMLPRVAHVNLVDYFTGVGGSMFGAWINPLDPMMSPSGQAIAMIGKAAHGATSSAQVTIAGAPTLPGGYPAVTGQTFTGPGLPTATVLVNLSGTAQTVPVGGAVPSGASYQEVTGNPTDPRATASAPARGTVGTTQFQLPPYSLTLID